MSKNAFDELLESVKDENHRKALAEVAEAVPELKNGYLRQSDYSRKMDQFQDRLKFADQYESWWKENYVPNALGEGKGATKTELKLIREAEELSKQYEELQKQASVGGNVTFEELSGHINKLIEDRGLARQEDILKKIDEKASGVEQFVNQNMVGYAHLTTYLPGLVYKHHTQFNEFLNEDELLKFAAENKHTDIRKAYDEYTSSKRREIEEKQIAERIKAAEEEGYKKALAEKGMNPNSMPVDNQPPQMGHFQARMLGIKTGEDGSVSGAENAELGSGATAIAASRNWDRAAS